VQHNSGKIPDNLQIKLIPAHKPREQQVSGTEHTRAVLVGNRAARKVPEGETKRHAAEKHG